MFKLEEFGYSKEDVEKYLVEILKRLENFENTITMQQQEIKSLEKRIEVLKNSDYAEESAERAKENADQIVLNALLEVNELQERINQAIEKELEK